MKEEWRRKRKKEIRRENKEVQEFDNKNRNKKDGKVMHKRLRRKGKRERGNVKRVGQAKRKEKIKRR